MFNEPLAGRTVRVMGDRMHDIRAFLINLGSTAEDVATTLTDKGVKGRPGHPCRCPVAKALGAQFGRRYWVGGPCGYELGDTELTADGFLLPVACDEFIAAFDNGSFPELRELSPIEAAS